MTAIKAISSQAVRDDATLMSPNSASASAASGLSTPEWIESLKEDWGEKVRVPEWEDDDFQDREKRDSECTSGPSNSYRQKNGWLGTDLVHDAEAPVRITEYYVQYGHGEGVDGLSSGGIGTKLTGIVQFTARAESHRGFCHGGSMCSVMDDAIGWCGFMVTGRVEPWSGFTVQINTSLKTPIPVNSTLLVTAQISQIERRKVSIHAELVDPCDSGDEKAGKAVHATAEGLVVVNKGVLPLLSKRGSLETFPSSLELS